MFAWTPEPWLDDPEAQVQAARRELAHWQTIYRQFHPESAGGCSFEGADSSAAVKQLRLEVSRRPDVAALSGCLQNALVAAGKLEEAIAIAESFLARHGDDEDAWYNLLALLDEPTFAGKKQRLLEQRAASHPTLENRTDLLRFYDSQNLTEERDALVSGLEVEDLSADDAWGVCIALDSDDVQTACERRLFHRLLRQKLDKGQEEVREYLRSAMLRPAALRRDWTSIDEFLDDWPHSSLHLAWSSIVHLLPMEEACPRLIAAVGEEALGAVLFDPKHSFRAIKHVARLLEHCGRNDLALAAVAPHLPAPVPDLNTAWRALVAPEDRAMLEQQALSIDCGVETTG